MILKTEQLSPEIRDLLKALGEEFKTDDLSVTEILPSKRVRIGISSPLFEGVSQMTRQDRVWDVLDKVLGPEAHLKVTLILAFAPSELEASENSETEN